MLNVAIQSLKKKKNSLDDNFQTREKFKSAYELKSPEKNWIWNGVIYDFEFIFIKFFCMCRLRYEPKNKRVVCVYVSACFLDYFLCDTSVILRRRNIKVTEKAPFF